MLSDLFDLWVELWRGIVLWTIRWTFSQSFLSFGALLLSEITLPTNWFIWFFSSDQFDFLRINCSQGKCGLFSAINTHSWQLNNFFSNWQQIDDVAESFSLEGTVQSGNNHDFSLVCELFTKFNDFGKELTLIDGNDFKFSGMLD